jgi:hypothetical protein
VSEQFLHISENEIINMRHIVRAERPAKQLTVYLTGHPNERGVRPSVTVALATLGDCGTREMDALFGALP